MAVGIRGGICRHVVDRPPAERIWIICAPLDARSSPMSAARSSSRYSTSAVCMTAGCWPTCGAPEVSGTAG